VTWEEWNFISKNFSVDQEVKITVKQLQLECSDNGTIREYSPCNDSYIKDFYVNDVCDV
jgi:hypothetical protein